MRPLADRIANYLRGLPPRASADEAMLTLQTALDAEDDLIMETMRRLSPDRFATLQAELRRLGEIQQIVQCFVLVLEGKPLPQPNLPPINLPPSQ